MEHRASTTVTTPPPPGGLATDIATAVLTGVVTARMPVQRWARGARWSLHGGMAALAAAGTGVFLSDPERFSKPGQEVPSFRPGPVAATTFALAAGAATLGASRGGEAADAWVERRLTARGVRRPRLWMGVVAAGASLAMSVADRRRTAREVEPTDEESASTGA